ncbi:MAG: class I SAM-dependent methyltransferase [Ilumatobacteraceae bacterium]
MTAEYGTERGKVFPASKARSLLNPARRLVQPPRRVIDALGLAGDATVLEVGCGPGYFSPTLAGAVPSGTAVLADLQFEMLRVAQERLVSHDNVRFVQLDATRLPFATASFDAVLVVLMLGEIPESERFLSECRRVLRPGGLALFAESRRDSDFISRTALPALVEPHGFALDEIRGWRWEYTARFSPVPH